MTEVLNSRRTFLKTAALGGAAMIGAGAAASAQATPKKIAESTYDFVIVGAGCGGLVCAIRAAQNGLKPILIEKMGSPAGNTVYRQANVHHATHIRPALCSLFRGVP